MTGRIVDVVVLALVLAVCALCIRRLVLNKKNGISNCSGCSGCASHGSCTRDVPERFKTPMPLPAAPR